MHRSNHDTNSGANAIRRTGGYRWAFTLVEVLVVIAITVILFGLLIRPLIDTLRYTKDAQLQAAAQDSARKTMEILTREIGSAAYISDNATHSFNATLANLGAMENGALTEQYSNFLNIQVPKYDSVAKEFTSSGALAHIYDAKLDLVMARHIDSTLKDPTAGNEPIQFDKASGSNLVGEGGTRITSTPLMFPLAPGTTMIRYFIGLKNPDKTYSNVRDHINGTPPENTYVLYRAQFTPDALKTPTVSPNPPQYLLFDTDPSSNTPILDDPDFFRHVTTSDVNWMSPTHANYSASEAQAHNDRYEAWKLIAKPIIAAPEIDLLVMPHNTDRTLGYDGAGKFAGVAHYGEDFDPVTGAYYPVEHTSVAFLPGTISTDAAPSTTADYQERGIAGGTNGFNAGLPYIPTMYQSMGQAWTRPYTVSLYPQTSTGLNTSDYFYISQAIVAPTDGGGTAVGAAGDLVEYHVAGGTTTSVYDLTSSRIITNTTDVIPAAVNEDQGTISFSIPAVPGAGGVSATVPNGYNRTWYYTPPTSSAATNNQNAFPSQNVLDLVQNDDSGNVSPLNNFSSTDNSSSPTVIPGKYLTYAFIVPGSLRVYGPDMTAGPNSITNSSTLNVQPVLYTEVSANTPPAANQYQVDYFTGRITFTPLDQLSSATKDGTGQDTHYYWPVNSRFSVIYDYQSNMRPSATTAAIAASSNPASPLAVKVTYHSRESLNLNVGVRYIDSSGNSQNVLLSNSVKVGNINR